MTLSAGAWLPYPSGFAFTSSEGQIYLDSGALIDVSGSQAVSASVADNFIPVQLLLGPELANSPLQRNGPLRGQTIEVDIREHGRYDPDLNGGLGGYSNGTPLADTSGYVSLVQRSVGELTTAGGTVTLTAGDSVVMQSGSKIDVSGGSIDYPGWSRLNDPSHFQRSHPGYFASDAGWDLRWHLGRFTIVHPKWGMLKTITTRGRQRPFRSGLRARTNGGTIALSAPAVALDGSLLGLTVSGPRQQAGAPISSTLSLAFQAQQPTGPLFAEFSPTPPDVIFGANSALAPADDFGSNSWETALLRADRRAKVILSPTWSIRTGLESSPSTTAMAIFPCQQM